MQSRLNVQLGQSRSPLLFQCRAVVYDAGPTLHQRWLSASYIYTCVYSNHWTANQCCFNVDPTCLTMAQQQPNILYAYFAAQHCGNYYAGDTFLYRRQGESPRVVVSTAASHARVLGSFPGLYGLKETNMFLPHPLVKLSIVGSLHDGEVACSASDLQVWISNSVSGGQCHLTSLIWFPWLNLACMCTKVD